MKSLSSLLKLQFYIGFIGTLALMPVLYGIQAIWGGFDHSEFYIWLDIIMNFIAPLLSGVSFALTGLVAFPALKYLQRRDIVRDLLWKYSMKDIVNRNSRSIASALFMVSGALVGAAAMAWLIPVREHNLLDLRVGLAIGAFVGYVGFRTVSYLVNGRSKHE